MQENRPSNTATLIAHSLLLASAHPALGTLVPRDEPAVLSSILAAQGRRDWITPFLGFKPARWFFHRIESFLLPGIIAHYILRKRQIESEVTKMIAHGCRRVVVLGAGYDTLCWRLHKNHSEVEFVEIDHPATQHAKLKALQTAHNLTFLSADLSAILPSVVLGDNQQTPTRSTTIIIEGLTMYLKATQVTRLLRDAAHCAGPNGKVIFTFMESDETGGFGFRGESPMIARWLQAKREPFRWGTSRGELSGFLETAGLKLETLLDHDHLRENHLLPRKLDSIALAEGELIATAIPL